VTLPSLARAVLRLARAQIASNHAQRKVIETIRMLVVLREDDPLMRGFIDAETALVLSDGLADKVARQATEGE
jgi:adenylate cyclase